MWYFFNKFEFVERKNQLFQMRNILQSVHVEFSERRIMQVKFDQIVQVGFVQTWHLKLDFSAYYVAARHRVHFYFRIIAQLILDNFVDQLILRVYVYFGFS